MLATQIFADLLQQACISAGVMGRSCCVHLSMRCNRVTERQGYSDYDYSEGHKLD
jgi:hypothetical protein